MDGRLQKGCGTLKFWNVIKDINGVWVHHYVVLQFFSNEDNICDTLCATRDEIAYEKMESTLEGKNFSA